MLHALCLESLLDAEPHNIPSGDQKEGFSMKISEWQRPAHHQEDCSDVFEDCVLQCRRVWMIFVVDLMA